MSNEQVLNVMNQKLFGTKFARLLYKSLSPKMDCFLGQKRVFPTYKTALINEI